MRVRFRPGLILATTLLVAVAAVGPAPWRAGSGAERITGPYASLLAASTNLGSSRAGDAQLTVTLSAPERPTALTDWAQARELAVRWRPGQDWAIVTGGADRIAAAFGVPVNDYRGRRGQVFYASPRQPALPPALRGDVTAVGRVLSYLPHRMARPVLPLDVPRPGLTPQHLLTTYNAAPLAAAGYTGKGQTLVVFAFDGYDQHDLDLFADSSGLPRFTPEVVGGPLGAAHGETVMDLQVAHAIAPDARLVVVNALPTVDGGGHFEKIGRMFDNAAQRYPGSVWSLSIGWGCEALVTAADVAPVRSALTRAHRRGITVFDASGDNAGLECKGGEDWSAPPGPDDVGVDTIASLPEITSVGGTTLSTDMDGRWLGEQAWIDVPMSQGTSGGASRLFARPDYQRGLVAGRGAEQRLVPDVSAVADPFTGVRIVFEQTPRIGGGTSQAAPIWAGMTALMNQYVIAHGGRPLGDINPLLYEVARGSSRPGFRDVTDGGNAVDNPVPGYDLVTGLGTPNVDNLARNLLEAQKEQSVVAGFAPG
ncbi:S53 family peptidase [Mycobacterium sp. CVI_P3]|uniref:S53 family peptidase n=1 Tax=Mycobacterium pinniadriaticum TaxID=2994102 RepID=A0ABT3SBF8_9MYCO|nr:S53 family peptidase [Mycobacterium pinniadriaticum]MCX2930435.1 S53 family peptidase [Mycobacterium pinniadriaticum]MCX2936859.1 S53 family peptidase [Mycobacterium pinniadriaticum]